MRGFNMTNNANLLSTGLSMLGFYGAFIRTGDYRIFQLTTREERSFWAEVQVIMGNIP